MSSGLSLESLARLETETASALAIVSDDAQAEAFRIKYLGKKGLLRSILKELGALAPEERKTIGAKANDLSTRFEEAFAQSPWKQGAARAAGPWFDYSLPGYPLGAGTLHPLMKIRTEICSILASMGFDVAYGPEVETDYYNFGALNFPEHHPARDMQDTFTVAPGIVLRTHTSPVQVRVMENQKPPIRSIMPGRVYRNEEISSRSYCLFHQVEGLYVDEGVSFADLKGTLLSFCRRFFDAQSQIRIRPSFFPFTEPSIEADVKCFLCKGNGCGLCKQSGWLEILGAGMVHPNVLANVNIDPEKYTGFAFGMGIERIAMLKHGVDDIRLFFENDVRFLKQL
jgi:phenylalanyl-tRNA synthetase alpha chain